jgi:hypothetical protein
VIKLGSDKTIVANAKVISLFKMGFVFLVIQHVGHAVTLLMSINVSLARTKHGI